MGATAGPDAEMKLPAIVDCMGLASEVGVGGKGTAGAPGVSAAPFLPVAAGD